jgi:hypothetical protein
MKIALTPYPFAGLSGTAKKPVSVPADNGGLAAAGTSRPPVRLDVAVLRYLRTVEEMTAQIMDMTGDGPPAVVDEYPGTTPAGVSGGSAIARGDILVFFPGPAPDGENEDNGAELVVVKGTGRAEYAAASETPREEALEGLAKDVGQALARLGRGVAPVVFDHGPPRPRERFIVSVDTVDGVTVPTVIHDAPSGVALVFNNGGGELSDGRSPTRLARSSVFCRVRRKRFRWRNSRAHGAHRPGRCGFPGHRRPKARRWRTKRGLRRVPFS